MNVDCTTSNQYQHNHVVEALFVSYIMIMLIWKMYIWSRPLVDTNPQKLLCCIGSWYTLKRVEGDYPPPHPPNTLCEEHQFTCIDKKIKIYWHKLPNYLEKIVKISKEKKIPNVDIGQKHIFPKIDFEIFVKRIGVGGGLGLILVTDPRLK